MGNLWSRGDRGFVAGGAEDPSTHSTAIDYFAITTTGNAADFGDLTGTALTACGSGNSTRALIALGDTGGSAVNVIDYITTASTGNAADFGNLLSAKFGGGSCATNVRWIMAGGSPSTNVIEYSTIASVGNGIDFGNLSAAVTYPSGLSSPTRGLFCGGTTPSKVNTIDYITIDTLGNAIDFGDLTATTAQVAAFSSTTRGCFGGGLTPTVITTIDQVTIATTGNATDFGDLTVARKAGAGSSNNTRGIAGGGFAPAVKDVLDYITIASGGTATDFGNMTSGRYFLASSSTGHGGLELESEPRGLPVGRGRAFFGGGETPARVNTINEIHIPTLGSVSDFGDAKLGYSSTYNGANSYTRAIIMNRSMTGSPYTTTVVESFEMQSRGNGADFGDLSAARREGGNLSSSTRGVTGGGEQ